MLCTSADSGTIAPRYALPATRRVRLIRRAACAGHLRRRRSVRTAEQRQIGIEPLHQRNRLPSTKHAGHHASTCSGRRSQPARPRRDSSSDGTPYSWIGRSSVTGARVARRVGERLRRSDERADDFAHAAEIEPRADPPATAGAAATARPPTAPDRSRSRHRSRRGAADPLRRPRAAPTAGTRR